MTLIREIRDILETIWLMIVTAVGYGALYMGLAALCGIFIWTEPHEVGVGSVLVYKIFGTWGGAVLGSIGHLLAKIVFAIMMVVLIIAPTAYTLFPEEGEETHRWLIILTIPLAILCYYTSVWAAEQWTDVVTRYMVETYTQYKYPLRVELWMNYTHH